MKTRRSPPTIPPKVARASFRTGSWPHAASVGASSSILVPRRLPGPRGVETGTQPRRRSGALLFELVAAAALFGVVLMIAVPMLASVAAIREASLHRQLAQVEVANVLEQIAARHRAGESIAAVAPSITLAPELAAVLANAQLTVDVAPWDDVPDGVRVHAQLTWTTDAQQPAAPVEVLACFVDRAVTEGTP